MVSGERAGVPPRTPADQPATSVGEGARPDQPASRIRDTESPAGRDDGEGSVSVRDRSGGGAGGRPGEHGRSVTKAPAPKRTDGDLPQTPSEGRSAAAGEKPAPKDPADLGAESMKKENSLFGELAKAGTDDLVGDYAELAIDQLLKEGVLRELPGVATVLGLIRTYRAARDYIFFKKIKKFAESMEKISDEKRQKFASQMDENPEYREKVTDALLLLLDQLDDLEKSVLLARAFTAFVRGNLDSFYTFQRYGEIIKATNVIYLRNFYQTVEDDGELDNPRNFVSDQALPLLSMGLVELGVPQSFQEQTSRRGFTSFVINDFGAKFIRTVIRRDDIKPDEGDTEK